MVIAHCKQQKFIDYLRKHGCEVVSHEYWNEHNVVIFKKEGISDSIPIILEKVFYHFKVAKICEMLEIPIPNNQHEIYNVSKPIKDK